MYVNVFYVIELLKIQLMDSLPKITPILELSLVYQIFVLWF